MMDVVEINLHANKTVNKLQSPAYSLSIRSVKHLRDTLNSSRYVS